MMDLQVGLFCIAFAVLSSLAIYIILSISSIKEDSFDEAKANRRKIMKQFQDESKVSSEKAKEKKTKKAIKKVKEKKDGNEIVNTENKDFVEKENIKELQKVQAVDESASTEIKLEPTVAKAKDKKKVVQSVQQTQHLQKESAEIGNPSVHNKNLTTAKVPLEKVSTIKENKKKKKDLDKEKETENKSVNNERDPTPNKYDVANNETTQTSSQNTIQDTAFCQPGVLKPSKKKRSEVTSLNQLKNAKEAVSINLLVSLIQKAELSRSEIQTLIDALLNKQQDDVSEWLKGRQDPVVKLKKQLSDGEQALRNEKEVNLGLQAKLRELRAEVTNERMGTRAAEEQSVTLQAELRALSHKLHTVTEDKHGLTITVQQLQKQLSEEQIILKLKEEQIIKQRHAEEKNHEVVMGLKSQVSQLSAQYQENLRIIEEYQKVQAEIKRAFDNAQLKINELQGELKTQERTLTDAKSEIENLRVTNKNLYEQNDHLTSQFKNQCQEVTVLREKNESLAKINAENWENGFSYKKQGNSDLEARLEEKNKQIEQLTSELEFTRNKVQELNVSLSRSKSDSAKNQMLLDKANTQISLLNEKFNEATRSVQDDIINQLKNSLSERNNEVSILTNEVEMCKQRNNALRNKNWKIVEALTKAEKALQTKLRNEQNSNEQNICERSLSTLEEQKIHGTIVRLMKHLYPDITLDENIKDSLDDSLASLEETVLSRTMNGADKTNSPELQAHNSHLQALVVHYKGIITDTERMLNQLQKHVEVEEARWKGKIKSLEEEITKLRSNHTSEVFLHA